MTNNDFIIEIKNLSHSFNNKKIYENLNLNIKKGSVFAILGKNGVGKSTLINILIGYIKPKNGECLIFNEPSHNLSANTKRDIALLHEGFPTYDFMSIKQIEKYFSSFYEKWESKIFYELINLMGLNFNQKISTLSFGQKSQVVLGLIFAQNAKLLILDDYSMGLDAGYRRLFIDYLKEYIQGTNKTVLITSHIMSDLIDEIAIIQKGGEIYQDSIQNFIQNFRCYKIDKNKEIDTKEIHRIEEYKDYKKIFTFKENKNLYEEKIDFEDKFLGFVGKY